MFLEKKIFMSYTLGKNYFNHNSGRKWYPCSLPDTCLADINYLILKFWYFYFTYSLFKCFRIFWLSEIGCHTQIYSLSHTKLLFNNHKLVADQYYPYIIYCNCSKSRHFFPLFNPLRAEHIFPTTKDVVYTSLMPSKCMYSGCAQGTERTYIYVLATQRVKWSW